MSATQLGDIANWSSGLLARVDIQDKLLEFARDVYLMICTKVPFEILQTTSAERATILDVATYDLSDLDVAGLVSIRMTYSTNSSRRLRRSHVRVYDALASVTHGRPSSYARWGSAIEFNRPVDSATYTYRLRYWARPQIGSDIATTQVVTPVEWDELLKWETHYRALYLVGQPEIAMSLMQPSQNPRYPSQMKLRSYEMGIIPRLWNDLLLTIQQREYGDEDFSINPVRRPYGSVR